MLGIFKPKIAYQYQLSHSETIVGKEIVTNNELINYVIGVNNGLIDQNKTGWLQIKRVASHKKNERILFALRLELPLLEDNPYFEELLQPFNTKKPIPYDESTIVEDVLSNKEIDSTDTTSKNSLPESLQALADTGKQHLSDDSTDESPVSETESVIELKKQLAEVTTLLEIKNEEINKLKQESLNYDNSHLNSQKQSYVRDSSVSVADVNQLIEAELLQLKQDVEEQDKRKFIAESVVERINQDKQQAISSAVALLEEKKENSLSEAKKNYDDRVQEIETAFLIEKSEKENELKQQYDEKCQNEITSEYTKQTAILEAFIQTRKEKLLTIQQGISEKIEQSVGSLISNP